MSDQPSFRKYTDAVDRGIAMLIADAEIMVEQSESRIKIATETGPHKAVRGYHAKAVTMSDADIQRERYTNADLNAAAEYLRYQRSKRGE